MFRGWWSPFFAYWSILLVLKQVRPPRSSGRGKYWPQDVAEGYFQGQSFGMQLWWHLTKTKIQSIDKATFLLLFHPFNVVPGNYVSLFLSLYNYSEGTCPRRLLYHLFEAPVLGPWAHLGFEKKRPQSLNKRPTKAWGTNRNGLDVKLAPVANHNGLDAKLLRSSWKTTKAWVANHNGLDAKLLRSSWKNY